MRYDNLQKNGRLNKLTGNIAHILNMKLIMGADRNGNIALFDKPRGTTRMIEKLLSFIEKSGKNTSGENIVISHCNNLTLAQRLADAIRKEFSFSDIYIVPTGGVSSLYTDENAQKHIFERFYKVDKSRERGKKKRAGTCHSCGNTWQQNHGVKRTEGRQQCSQYLYPCRVHAFFLR